MGTPEGNGLVEINGAKRMERGFNCMQLIRFLTSDGVTDWDEWHMAHVYAAAGQCPFTSRCHIHARSVDKALNAPHRAVQLELF